MDSNREEFPASSFSSTLCFLLLIPIEGLSSGKVAVLAARSEEECGRCYWGKKPIPAQPPGSVTILLGQETHPGVCVRGGGPPLVEVWYPHVAIVLSPTSRRSASKTPPAGDLDRKVDRGRYRRANIMPGKHGFLRLRFAINSLLSSRSSCDLEEFTRGRVIGQDGSQVLLNSGWSSSFPSFTLPIFENSVEDKTCTILGLFIYVTYLSCQSVTVLRWDGHPCKLV